MKTETITSAPMHLSSEMRYASLHRTIENGMDTDRTWLELVTVCVELRRGDEARSAHGHIADPAVRRRAYNALVAAGVRVDAPPVELRGAQHEVAPQGHFEWIADGFRFLFLDHMPLTTVVATVTFPVVVGLGGFLTSSVQNSWLLPLLALIPALSVIGLVGALGRRILVESSQGLDDVPEVPSVGPLVREAGRFLVDISALGALFLGPALVLIQLADVGFSAIAAGLCVGGTLMPMAFAMRQTRDDWTCLSPMDLFSNIRRAGVRYFVAVGISFLLMAPAALSIWLTAGSALYLVVSVVGPLVVVPIFVMSRLFGQTMIDIERERSDRNRQLSAANRVVTTLPPTMAPAAAATRSAMRAPIHPEATRTERVATTTRPATARAPQPAGPGRPRPSGNGDVPGGSLGLRSDRAVAPSPHARSVAAAEPNPAPRSMRSEEAVPPTARAANSQPARPDRAPAPSTSPQRYRGPTASVIGEAIPDLTKLPGVSVLRGEARVAAGAAAFTRPH